MPKDPRRANTQALIKDAMVALLKEKTFDEITAAELAQAAGISRSSFYTHYTDKYDMIDRYQQSLFSTIEYIFNKNKGHIHATLLETYLFLARNPIYAALLSENSSKEIHQFILQKLINLIDEILPQERFQQPLGRVYVTTYYAHAIFGITQTWIRRKQKESPDQIADLLAELIPNADAPLGLAN